MFSNFPAQLDAGAAPPHSIHSAGLPEKVENAARLAYAILNRMRKQFLDILLTASGAPRPSYRKVGRLSSR